MALPKKKQSHSRSAKRNKANSKVTLTGVTVCQSCGHLKKNHSRCIHCNAK